MIQAEGVPSCLSVVGDISSSKICADAVQKTIDEFGGLDILVNNAAKERPSQKFEDITPEQLTCTFGVNVFGTFYLTKAALPHLTKSKGCIINVGSEAAYVGEPGIVDVAASKGSVTTFTRSLAQQQLADKGVRVNTLSVGPVWSPTAVMQPEPEVAKFGEGKGPMRRPAQPSEMGPAAVSLASGVISSYMSGQALHPNGGIQVAG